MSATVEQYYNSAWVDISDYVESLGDIPLTMNNRDGTVKSSPLSLDIAETIRDVRTSNYKFTRGDILRFKKDGTFHYGGYVDDTEYIYRDMKFQLLLKRSIMNLDTVLIEYDSLHSYFAAGANWYDYTASDFYSRSVVGVLWALKAMFTAAGLTLDTSDVDNIVLFTVTPWGLGGDDFDPAVDITYRDLFFTESSIYCIGHQIATYHTTLDNTDNNYNKDKITCWELVKYLIAYLNLAIKQTDTDAYKLIEYTSLYSVTDDDKFEYAEKEIVAESNINRISVTHTNNSLANYESATESSIINRTRGKGAENVSILPNCRILFSDAKNKTNKYEDGYATAGGSAYANALFALNSGTKDATINPASRLIRAKIYDVLKEEIETNYQSIHKTVLEHDLDYAWGLSRITQEEYDE